MTTVSLFFTILIRHLVLFGSECSCEHNDADMTVVLLLCRVESLLEFCRLSPLLALVSANSPNQ